MRETCVAEGTRGAQTAVVTCHAERARGPVYLQVMSPQPGRSVDRGGCGQWNYKKLDLLAVVARNKESKRHGSVRGMHERAPVQVLHYVGLHELLKRELHLSNQILINKRVVRPPSDQKRDQKGVICPKKHPEKGRRTSRADGEQDETVLASTPAYTDEPTVVFWLKQARGDKVTHNTNRNVRRSIGAFQSRTTGCHPAAWAPCHRCANCLLEEAVTSVRGTPGGAPGNGDGPGKTVAHDVALAGNCRSQLHGQLAR